MGKRMEGVEREGQLGWVGLEGRRMQRYRGFGCGNVAYGWVEPWRCGIERGGLLRDAASLCISMFRAYSIIIMFTTAQDHFIIPRLAPALN